MREENLAHLAAPPRAIYHQAAGSDLVLPIPPANPHLSLTRLLSSGTQNSDDTPVPHLEAVIGLQPCLCPADLNQTLLDPGMTTGRGSTKCWMHVPGAALIPQHRLSQADIPRAKYNSPT